MSGTKSSDEISEERWTIDQDPRPGMEWNRHIVLDGDHDARIAFMAHSAGSNPDLDIARATLAATAPELLAAIERLIEDAQPDNWDDDDDPDQASAWRAAFRALCNAKGVPVLGYMANVPVTENTDG